MPFAAVLAHRFGHQPGSAAMRALTRALFLLFPFVRRAWLLFLLRFYQWLFQYVNFVASEYLGASPKHVFDWGAAGFIVPRIRRGARVLDVGCGRGDLTWKIAEVASEVVGYDHSLSLVAAAARRDQAPHMRFYCGDAEAAMPVRASFDVAILSSVLPFVNDSGTFLRKLKHISAELLVRETRYDRDFTVPLMRSLGIPHRTDPMAQREYTRESLVRELEAAGWMVKECLDTYDIYVWAVRGNA